ncbi:MAG: serine kinase [Nitrospirales bacterium]|nr:serine kinase [Nitrospirales bacterium]
MIKIQDIMTRLSLAVRVEGNLDTEVSGCYISDLLSDVMAHSKEGELWITLQTHPNIVAVAVIKGLACIIIPNGRTPEPETIRRAESERITILTTPQRVFDVAGQIYGILKEEGYGVAL